MNWTIRSLALLMPGLLLAGCVSDNTPQYSLSGGEKGVFLSLIHI